MPQFTHKQKSFSHVYNTKSSINLHEIVDFENKFWPKKSGKSSSTPLRTYAGTPLVARPTSHFRRYIRASGDEWTGTGSESYAMINEWPHGIGFTCTPGRGRLGHGWARTWSSVCVPNTLHPWMNRAAANACSGNHSLAAVQRDNCESVIDNRSVNRLARVALSRDFTRNFDSDDPLSSVISQLIIAPNVILSLDGCNDVLVSTRAFLLQNYSSFANIFESFFFPHYSTRYFATHRTSCGKYYTLLH